MSMNSAYNSNSFVEVNQDNFEQERRDYNSN